MVKETNGKVGAVLVVGGGIGGMQASLDLAEAGFKVYLVEKGPAIGGVMAQLDKTFPTNDCAMCTLAPRMVECANHPNIEKLTYSEVDDIQGGPGAFTVLVRKKARSIRPDKCTGCEACTVLCPVRNKVQLPVVEENGELGVEEIEVDRIVSVYGAHRSSLLHVLQDVQARFSYLPEKTLRRVSRKLDITITEVYGAASFYKAFSLEPRGQHIIQVCLGTACHVRGAPRVLDELQRRLKIEPRQTTKDGLFTLDTVNCLGACAQGPIVTVDGRFYGKMSPSKVAGLLNSLTERVRV